MTRIRHVWLASILALATTAIASAQDTIPWITDLAQARKLAEQQQRLVLLHFWGDGCPPCQQLEANVFNQPELVRVLSSNFVCVKINVQQQQNIANYYKITQIPTDIIVLPTGVQVARATSPANANTYIAMLDEVRANAVTTGLQNGLQQVERVRNLAQQLVPSLPGLPARPDEQPAAQAVNSENAFAQNTPAANSPQPWRSVSNPANPTPNNVVNNEFVAQPAPTDQSNRPEANRAAAGSRYGNPYVNENVSATTASQAPNNAASDAQAEQRAVSEPAKEPQPAAVPSLTTQPTPGSERPSPVPQENPAATAGPLSPAPPAGNQNWTNPPAQSGVPAQTSAPTTGLHPAEEGAQVGSARTNPPNPIAANADPAQVPPGYPPLALDGHCPVTLMNLGKWERGNPQFGVVHRNRTYLFKSQVERDRFLAPAAADRFAPVLSGFDPVRFAESGQEVDGRREHGVLFDGQIFLFADEEALVRFEQQPQKYVAVVRQAMASTRAPQR